MRHFKQRIQILTLIFIGIVLISGCIPSEQPLVKPPVESNLTKPPEQPPVELPLTENVESIVLVPKIMSSGSEASLTIKIGRAHV